MSEQSVWCLNFSNNDQCDDVEAQIGVVKDLCRAGLANIKIIDTFADKLLIVSDSDEIDNLLIEATKSHCLIEAKLCNNGKLVLS